MLNNPRAPLTKKHPCRPGWLCFHFLVLEEGVGQIAAELGVERKEVEAMLDLCNVARPHTHPRAVARDLSPWRSPPAAPLPRLLRDLRP